ncbi:MAG TPA: hypothetical protein VFX30_10005 [bacterium]|nr:hypothetical protein [bacterium]
MTAPLGTVIPSLVVNTALTPTLATQAIVLQDGSTGRSSGSYVLATSMAGVALGTVLVGCRNDPAPAAIPHESSLPPNQGHCAPGSRDPFCQGYKASVEEMREHREQGHHSDQALTAILLGITIFVIGVPSAIMIIRRGRKIKRLEAELNAARPPESGSKQRQQGFFRRLFTRTPSPAPAGSAADRPKDAIEDATTEEATTTTTKVS